MKKDKKIINVSGIILALENTVENFKSGKTADKISMWETITSDTVKGCTIEVSHIPRQQHLPISFSFTADENAKIQTEINKFLENGIIEKVTFSEPDEFISNIFTRPKKDGRIRIILNLKKFKEQFIEKSHFKMESLKSALTIIRKNGFMASIDIADAYYSIKIKETDRKYFLFLLNDAKYQFSALVMGYSCSPRI
jgi:hypothetical protein